MSYSFTYDYRDGLLFVIFTPHDHFFGKAYEKYEYMYDLSLFDAGTGKIIDVREKNQRIDFYVETEVNMMFNLLDNDRKMGLRHHTDHHIMIKTPRGVEKSLKKYPRKGGEWGYQLH